MRVALVSYEYPPDTGFGGVGTYTWYQARALVRQGHDVRVVAGSLVPGVFHSEHDGVRVTRILDETRLEGVTRSLHSTGAGWAAVRVRNSIGAFLALRDLLEHETYDIVEFAECGADGMIASTVLPLRISVRLHSPARLIMNSYGVSVPNKEWDRDLVTTTFSEQVTINRADVRISPSRFLASEVEEHLGVSPPVHIVRNGLDLELFDRDPGADVASRFGLPPRGAAVIVAFTGRLEERKGLGLLPGVCDRVLQAHPQVHIVLAGADDGGVFASSIRPRCERSGNAHRLHHLGAVSLADVRGLVKHADIHLHPSTWDNAPYSCIEAMAAGSAVVTSDVGGMPEMIDHRRSGLVVRAGDESSFVEALSELIEDAPLRARLGEAARRTVEERHTDETMARDSVAVWERCIAGGWES